MTLRRPPPGMNSLSAARVSPRVRLLLSDGRHVGQGLFRRRLATGCHCVRGGETPGAR
jgi:hypothetical protein